MKKHNITKEYNLWGTKIGDEQWQEQLLLTTTDIKRVEFVKKLASQEGFDRIRVSKFNWERLNFFDSRLFNV